MSKFKLRYSTLYPIVILNILILAYISLLFSKPTPPQTNQPATKQPSINTQVINRSSLVDLLIQAFPPLASGTQPQNTDFEMLYKWLNQQPQSYMGYIEFKEYDDNAIDQNTVLKNAGVDTKKLQLEIDQEIKKKRMSWSEHSETRDQQIDELFFNIFFKYTHQADLDLLIISRENPYWMVLPRKAQVSQKIVDSFNQRYANASGLGKMMIYHPPKIINYLPQIALLAKT